MNWSPVIGVRSNLAHLSLFLPDADKVRSNEPVLDGRRNTGAVNRTGAFRLDFGITRMSTGAGTGEPNRTDGRRPTGGTGNGPDQTNDRTKPTAPTDTLIILLFVFYFCVLIDLMIIIPSIRAIRRARGSEEVNRVDDSTHGIEASQDHDDKQKREEGREQRGMR